MSAAPDVRTLAGPDDVARAVADEILAVLPRSASSPDVHVALAGGRTPLRAYEIVAERSAGVAWARVHLWWGDERCVPPDHPDSNFRAAWERLIDRVPVPASNVHRICGEDAPAASAAAYEAELARRPLDLVLLGMGADGHTASLFPGGAWLDEAVRWVVPSRAPVDPRDRVTLTFPALAAARRVVVAVTGAEKLPALRRALRGDPAVPASRLAGAAWVTDLRPGEPEIHSSPSIPRR